MSTTVLLMIFCGGLASRIPAQHWMPSSKLLIIHRGTSARRSKSTTILVQATAGSSRPRKRKRYEALNTRIRNLIDNYVHAEIGHFLRVIADNVEIHNFLLFSLQVLRQSQHIAHNVRHSVFRHFHCRHFDILNSTL